jgi:hypothetical protein
MAAGLHGSARTTPRVRAELQAAQASTRALAARYRLNLKTVAKWRKRTTTIDRPMVANQAPQHRADRGRGGDCRRVPPPHLAAVG